MRLGQAVVYVDANGDRHPAVVAGVHGSGPSMRKVIDVEYACGSARAQNVWHGADTFAGFAHWLSLEESLEESLDEPAPALEAEGTALIAEAWPLIDEIDENADDASPEPTFEPSVDEGDEEGA